MTPEIFIVFTMTPQRRLIRTLQRYLKVCRRAKRLLRFVSLAALISETSNKRWKKAPLKSIF